MKGKGSESKSECVKVAIRVRPMNKLEKSQNSTQCVDVDTANNTVSINSEKNETKTFQFDYVYPMETTQREIYDQVAFPIVDSIFQGYNGTVFAYGQTGCGKTFTMMGIVDNPELMGIIPNAFNHIFGFIKTEGESKKFLVRCSFVEIYNEEVRDLLSKNNNKLDIREDPKKGTFVKDLTYITLKDTQDIHKCLEQGNKNRHVGATSMNDQSSRSHSLFTVYLEIEENGKIKSGKLNLVDLAGSERVGKTNATGQTFDEGKKINLSLTALGSVIDALSTNRKYIPYKDSKLTRLLADSLGGNTKTVMFANISPASYNYDETLGTLRYASRAKLIKNAPKVNEDPKDALLRQYEEEIKALKAQLSNGGAPNSNDDQEGDDDVEENEDEGDNQNDAEPNTNTGKKPKKKKKKSKKIAGGNDAEEKEKLRLRIAELEKNMLDNKKLEINETEVNGDKEEMEKKIRMQEEENRKFKSYRERQIKQNEEMEKKLKKLEEDKKREEESLKNDANTLQNKIQSLISEMDDLKLDNTKDRADYLESVKIINRQNLFYRKVLENLLSEKEMNQIIQMSIFKEDEDKWEVPFYLKEKNMVLPTINKPKNFGDSKRIIFQNYDDDNGDDDKNNVNDNDGQEFKIKNSRSKIKLKEADANVNNKYFDKTNNRVNFRVSNDKFAIDARRKSKNYISPIKIVGKTEKNFFGEKEELNDDKNDIYKILMNQKERERYNQLNNIQTMQNGNQAFLNPMSVSTANHMNNLFNKSGNKGKIILNPVQNNNNNKLELSFKVNFEINNRMPQIMGNKKLKLAQIPEKDIDY
jgi:kinesin family protein 3/17